MHTQRLQAMNKRETTYSPISCFGFSRICMLVQRAKAKIKQKRNNKPQQHRWKQHAIRKSKRAATHGKRISAVIPKIMKKMVLVWFAFNECFFFVLQLFFSSFKGVRMYVNLSILVCNSPSKNVGSMYILIVWIRISMLQQHKLYILFQVFYIFDFVAIKWFARINALELLRKW